MSKFVVLLAAMTLLSARGFSTVAFNTVLDPVASTSTCPGSCYIESFQIYNDGSLPGAAPVQFFDLYFDPTLYLESSLLIPTDAVNSDWGAMILFSVGTAPAAFDALWNANGNYPPGTPPGVPADKLGPTDTNGNLGSFEVEFSYLGQGLPGAQPFAISDPTTQSVIQNGETGATPEPATLFYLCSSMLASIIWASRRRFVR